MKVLNEHFKIVKIQLLLIICFFSFIIASYHWLHLATISSGKSKDLYF